MNTRQMAVIQRAQAILADRPLYLDTETTGLDPRAEIVEIALIDHDGAVKIGRDEVSKKRGGGRAK